jgi:hypothetical protein
MSFGCKTFYVAKKNAARAVVTIQNMLGDPISGVTVSGTWSGLVNGDVSGATDSSGTVASPQMQRPELGRSSSSLSTVCQRQTISTTAAAI